MVQELGETALKGLKLTHIRIMGKELKDITALTGMPLKMVEFQYTKIKDLTPLKGAPIELLDIRGTEVTDITALKNMPLKKLYMNYTQIKDLTPLADMKLEILELGIISVVENGLEAIREMKSIQHMKCRISKAGRIFILEDWFGKFWERYDALLKEVMAPPPSYEELPPLMQKELQEAIEKMNLQK